MNGTFLNVEAWRTVEIFNQWLLSGVVVHRSPSQMRIYF